MIEVICELVDGPVFLAGQTLRCTITLRCPELDRQAPATSNSDVCENLAWVSAQVIHTVIFTVFVTKCAQLLSI